MDRLGCDRTEDASEKISRASMLNPRLQSCDDKTQRDVSEVPSCSGDSTLVVCNVEIDGSDNRRSANDDKSIDKTLSASIEAGISVLTSVVVDVVIGAGINDARAGNSQSNWPCVYPGLGRPAGDARGCGYDVIRRCRRPALVPLQHDTHWR